HAITTDAWRNSLDHYQEFVIIVALDLKIEDIKILNRKRFKPACQSGSKFTESNKTTKEPLSFTERIDKGSSFKKDERV
ncbi:hypothetical protein ABMX89_13720, partial [Lacticaseibacillus rhamnosus]